MNAMRTRRALVLAILGALCAACLPTGGFDAPDAGYTVGALLLEEDFARVDAWGALTDPSRGVTFGVEDGAYRARIGAEALRARLGAAIYRDSVIEVVTQQASTYADNAYGVMCRADPAEDGDGYYFLISGDGHYTIRRGAHGSAEALIQWTPTSAIARGQSRNRVRAVCVGDYLALYVNDRFVADVRDLLYSSGAVGLVAGVPRGGNVEVTFDDLFVFEAQLNK